MNSNKTKKEIIPVDRKHSMTGTTRTLILHRGLIHITQTNINRDMKTNQKETLSRTYRSLSHVIKLKIRKIPNSIICKGTPVLKELRFSKPHIMVPDSIKNNFRCSYFV